MKAKSKRTKQAPITRIPKKTAGAVTGAVVGAVVAGPVGAAIGGAVGAAVAAATVGGKSPKTASRSKSARGRSSKSGSQLTRSSRQTMKRLEGGTQKKGKGSPKSSKAKAANKG